MSKRYRLFAAALIVVCAHAQTGPTATVRGRLHVGNKQIAHGYAIELENIATHQALGRIEVASDGEFTARHVPHGEYMARVVNYHGDTIAQQFVSVHESAGLLELRIAGRPAAPAGGTVSLRELRHPPARKAIDAAAAGQRFAEWGKFDRAASELEKAVRISPEFALAHCNLGLQYLRLGRYAEGEAEIRRAVEIEGGTALNLSLLAAAQLAQRRVAEAVESAQAALRLRADAPVALQVLEKTRALGAGVPQ